jgi:hypothetical protein
VTPFNSIANCHKSQPDTGFGLSETCRPMPRSNGMHASFLQTPNNDFSVYFLQGKKKNTSSKLSSLRITVGYGILCLGGDSICL